MPMIYIIVRNDNTMTKAYDTIEINSSGMLL